MDYKHTLNLPQTDFPMRANLPQREPEILARWQTRGPLPAPAARQRRRAERYVLHDGPPYANGHVHLGTALNKIIKDIVVKRQLMAGRHAPYVPGWDCHGMPIEHQVLRELGGKAREHVAARDPPPLPRLRREVLSTSSASSSSASACSATGTIRT